MRAGKNRGTREVLRSVHLNVCRIPLVDVYFRICTLGYLLILNMEKKVIILSLSEIFIVYDII